MDFPQHLSDEEKEDDKPTSQSHIKCTIAMTHLDTTTPKKEIAKEGDIKPPINPSCEQKCHMTLEDMQSSKYPATKIC
jgi:hypothetical protein